MEIVKVKLDDIKAYEFNAKEHPREQVEQIKNSINEFGYNDLIAVDENNVVIEGHGRLIALKELDYEEVEVIVLRHLSEEQKNAYRIVHNQLTMNTGWDMEILKDELRKIKLDMYSLGIEESLLDELEDENLEAIEDDFNIEEALEEIQEPQAKYGDVYKLGNHRLMCGDSTNKEDIEILMNGNKADLLVTDPPYNINVSNSQGMTIENDNMSNEEFIKFLTNAFKRGNEALNNGASFYIWYADTMALEFHQACRNVEWEIRENLVWVKSQFILGRQDYHWRHEPCLYGWKSGDSHYFVNDRTQSTVIDESVDIDTMPIENLKTYIKSLMEYSTILYEDKPKVNSEHPTMKPIKLISRLVKNSSKRNQVVLDLFGGSGTTLITCEQLNRTCYMCEYDPKYVDVIIRRFEEFTGEKAVKL